MSLYCGGFVEARCTYVPTLSALWGLRRVFGMELEAYLRTYAERVVELEARFGMELEYVPTHLR